MTLLETFKASGASFLNAPWQRNQHIYVNLMPDKERGANIEHYTLLRCHSVLQSIMAAKVYVFVHAIDMGMFLEDVLSGFQSRETRIMSYVES